MNNKLILLLSLFLITFASAQEYEVNQELDIKIICINEGYCSASSYCNINIIDPESNLSVTGQNMTNQGSFHNYTITPVINGIYKVGGFCIDGEYSKEIDYEFMITPTGDSMDTGESIRYLILLTILFCTLIFTIYIAWVTPFNNSEYITPRGETIVTKINGWKYLKILMFWLSIGIALWIITIVAGMTNNYIQFEGLKSMMINLYIFTMTLGYGTTMAVIWLTFYHLWKDIVLNKEIVDFGKAVLTNK